MNKTFLEADRCWRLLWADTQGPREDGHMHAIWAISHYSFGMANMTWDFEVFIA